MKLLVIFCLLVVSLPVLAWNELECEGLYATGSVKIDVQQPFPSDSYFKQARLWTRQGTSNDLRYLTVNSRTMDGFGKIEYSTVGLRLEVDYWPDQSPQWGRIYRGALQASLHGRYQTASMNCHFPSAQ